jgi:hypothetical protein
MPDGDTTAEDAVLPEEEPPPQPVIPHAKATTKAKRIFDANFNFITRFLRKCGRVAQDLRDNRRAASTVPPRSTGWVGAERACDANWNNSMV